jgi:CelD/BcsL family acetyltransferase involved in cellulose biosynthesis
MKIVQALDLGNWTRFVVEHPQGNNFHTPEMFQVFERATGHKPALWAAVEGERILALFTPVEITVLGGPLRRLTTRAVVYGSVLSEPGSEGKQAVKRLLEAYRQEADRRLLFTELRNLAPLDGLKPVLDERGFAYQEHLNYLIDLNRPPEEILQNIGRRTRKQIRRGLRTGVVAVEEVQDRQGLAECYALLRHTYAAAGVPLADISLFEAALDLLVPREMARFSLACIGEKAVACSVDLLYKDTVYGWYGGTDREYTYYVPNELLTWKILEWAAQRGYRVYDFGGAGKPDEEYGVRDFKAKFGGELVAYGRNVCVHAPLLLNASRIGYSLFRWLGLFGSPSASARASSPRSERAALAEAETGAEDPEADMTGPRPAVQQFTGVTGQ